MATIEKSEANSPVGNLNPTLPGIDELPDADTVIYDGQCNFCRRQVQRLNWFANGSVAFISLHDSRVADMVPELSRDDLMQRMYVVTKDKQSFGGADAIKYLSRKHVRMWPAAPLLHIPFSMPVWHYFYDLVARSRYSIAGKLDDCENGQCDVHLKK